MARTTTHRTALTATALVAALSFAGCGSDDDSSATTAEYDSGAARSGEQAPAEVDGGLTAGPSIAGPATPAPTFPAGQRFIVDVTVGVEVDDVGAGVDDVVAIAARHGGQVYGSDVDLHDPRAARARLVLKVPPDELEATISDLAASGTLVSRVQSSENVTDQLTDLDTRISTQRESVGRIQSLLASATDLGEIVQLEAELTTRQTLLEQLLAQQHSLDDDSSLATLTVDLTTSATPVTTSGDGIGDAFADGGRAFLAAVTGVLIFLGLIAPFLLVGLVVGAAALAIRRRVPRSRSAAPLLPPAPVADQRTSAPDSEGAARS